MTKYISNISKDHIDYATTVATFERQNHKYKLGCVERQQQKYQSVYNRRDASKDFSLKTTRVLQHAWDVIDLSHLLLVPFQGDIGPTRRDRGSTADRAKA